MEVELRYGREGLRVEVPDENLIGVLHMNPLPPLEDPEGKVARALEDPIGSPPLRELVRGKGSTCVVVSDITRPVPNSVVLPPLLGALEEAGIPKDRITILVATGIHRPNEGKELVELLGEEIVRNYRVVNHRARVREEQVLVGHTSRGTPVWIDREYVRAEFKVLTGLVEPHLMAGFSGGRKSICPGIAGLETVRMMHGPKVLEHPRAVEGALEDNPFHEEVLEMAHMVGVDFILNVSLSEDRRITGIFAGDLEEAHLEAVRFVRRQVEVVLPEPVDVVLTTSAGYPLDLTFYQAIKGYTAALPAVKEGGTIVLAARCEEGLGGPEFSELIRTMTPEGLMREIWREDFFVVDQWQAEELCRALRKAEAFFFSEGVDPEDVRAWVRPFPSLEEALAGALKGYGPSAKLAVLPEGPYVLPVIRR
ncbi:MAG TPA: nickel-dependent lactate racemase [Candidatus Latescibacteria bacterium]|nr:nickel-dependent lactate racemase [Candidatus Latescibacterota bacterium]